MAAHELNSGRFAIPGVPVFMYHDVCAGAAAGERYRLSLAMFREQLEFLREQGFAVEDLAGAGGKARAAAAWCSPLTMVSRVITSACFRPCSSGDSRQHSS